MHYCDGTTGSIRDGLAALRTTVSGPSSRARGRPWRRARLARLRGTHAALREILDAVAAPGWRQAGGRVHHGDGRPTAVPRGMAALHDLPEVIVVDSASMRRAGGRACGTCRVAYVYEREPGLSRARAAARALVRRSSPSSTTTPRREWSRDRRRSPPTRRSDGGACPCSGTRCVRRGCATGCCSSPGSTLRRATWSPGPAPAGPSGRTSPSRLGLERPIHEGLAARDDVAPRSPPWSRRSRGRLADLARTARCDHAVHGERCSSAYYWRRSAGRGVEARAEEGRSATGPG